MATVSFTINSSNYTTSQSLSCNVGDALNIDYTTTSNYHYGMLAAESPDVPGCSYTGIATYTTIYGTLIGTPTTAGTYRIRMCRRTRNSGTMANGDYIYLTVSGSTTTYYSNLYYNANTGTGAPSDDKDTKTVSSKPADRATSISATIPTLENGVFKGWSKTQYTPGTGTSEYIGGDNITIPYLTTDTGITLYAVWGIKKKYYSKLIYNTLGGSPTIADDRVEKLEEELPTDRVSYITTTEPIKTGNVFKGWSTTKGATIPEYIGGDNIIVPYLDTDTASVVLFAIYEKQKHPCIYVGDKKVAIMNMEKKIIVETE